MSLTPKHGMDMRRYGRWCCVSLNNLEPTPNIYIFLDVLGQQKYQNFR